MSKGSLTEGQDFSVVFDPSSEEVVLLVLVGLGDISTTVLYSEPEPVADSEDDEDSDISGSGDGLSKGQLAGIIIAAVLGSLVIIGVAGVIHCTRSVDQNRTAGIIIGGVDIGSIAANLLTRTSIIVEVLIFNII